MDRPQRLQGHEALHRYCRESEGRTDGNLCKEFEEDVIVDRYTDGSFILIFKIPRAPFDVKPVYIDGNPRNTYRRNHEGDYICTQAEISRMYAEADLLAHPLDSTLLKNYRLAKDFDQPTINQYRQLFKLRQPRHAWKENNWPDPEIKDPKVTHKRIADALGISERGAEKITKRLRESGDIRRKGGRFGGEWEVLK